jgi:HemY protein
LLPRVGWRPKRRALSGNEAAMIRVVMFLLAVAVLAAGFAWLADRPGEVAVTWLGYRLETSVTVAALAVAALVVALTLAWAFVRGVLRSPEQVSLFFRHRRAVRGYLALTRGLIAIGAGDLKLARRSAEAAARLAPGDPLTLLLIAQSAQMAGDRAAAERAFRDMTRRDDTRLLGLRGLYIEAQRRNDVQAARLAAEEAAKLSPVPAWAGQAVLEERCAAADWTGALEALERMKGVLAKDDYRRKRAVLLTARAQALAEVDRDTSLAAVLEAVKLAPDLVPAAALAGRRLAEANEWRKARRILETAWTINPHPDIAEAYANLRLGDSARERLARMQKLAAKAAGQLEGALAVARAAIDAREFKVAREALAPYLSAPTRRVATLMAELEEVENNDLGRVREWMSRAVRAAPDPVWTADGVVSDRWLPVTPDGKLDGFAWKLPLAELTGGEPAIEAPPPPPASIEAKTPEEAHPDKPARSGEKRKTRPVEPIIPLIHAPDDPGTGPALDGEPVPEPAAPAADAWQRIRGLFR